MILYFVGSEGERVKTTKDKKKTYVASQSSPFPSLLYTPKCSQKKYVFYFYRKTKKN